MMKKAKPVLNFSRPVHSLQVKLGSYEGKYCPNCVKIGYTNPGKPILKQYQKKKIELMNKAKKRKKDV